MKHSLTILVSLLLASYSAQADTLIHAGRLLDTTNQQLLSEMTVVVDGNSIKAVEPGYRQATESDTVIDLKNHTVLPGLMDMHVHLRSEYTANSRLNTFIMNPDDAAYQAAYHARTTLLSGFTTVRDLGGKVVLSLRNAINRGLVDGPRIFAAGNAIATTGGHADPTNGWADHLHAKAGILPEPVNGPYEAAKAVRQRYKEGSDLIKITATGGVLSVAKSGQNAQFTDEELKAIIAAAKDYGFHVAAHAHGAEGMKRAIRAGVSTIEHGTYMDDEAFELMKKHKTWYVPTIIAGTWVAEKAKDPGFFPELVRPKAASIGPLIQDTFAKAYKAGVPILFGTDTGVNPHGTNAREFALMVEAGMPPMEAIYAATILNARFLKIDDKLGAIEANKLADIIAVPGNPLEDITVLQQVAFVMKDGKVYRQ